VTIPVIGIHYDERYWKSPNAFDSDHFTAEEIAKRPSFTFMPFGEGPRNCMGLRFAAEKLIYDRLNIVCFPLIFAQVNLKFAIATVIKNFKVELDCEKVQLPLEFNPKDPSLAPKGGFWVKCSSI
jgi:cytochrome P450 family 6